MLQNLFASCSVQGGSGGGSDWEDRTPKTYESNFIRHSFIQFGKQHSRYKAILSFILLSLQCCEVCIMSFTVVNP